MLFRLLLKIGLVVLLLYIFFVSIDLMGASFKFFGKNFAEQLLSTTSNPFVGLFIGILATSVVQSSSTTTSMTVGLVAGGALNVQGAIPIIIGSNLGTSVTNTLVAVGHIARPSEFRRAFAAATVHDFFNIIAIGILFPLQLTTNMLGIFSSFLAEVLEEMGGVQLVNPLKLIVKPCVNFIIQITKESGELILLLAVILLFISLRYLVATLRLLAIAKIETFFDKMLFKTAPRAILVGLLITVAVQSSSITTSLVVPLAGAGILSLRQLFPFTLGANIGTTITAMMASLVTGNQLAITVAFAHFLFNVFGILVIWPIKHIPIRMSEAMAKWSIKSKLIPLVYVTTIFFIVPLGLVYFSR